jgi:hypothetical protein
MLGKAAIYFISDSLNPTVATNQLGNLGQQ